MGRGRDFYIVEVANGFGISPRVISALFYQRILDGSRCPYVCGRRHIPEDYVEEIRQVLIKRGKIKEGQTSDGFAAAI
jgi:hypothetical protein